ncbi:S-methyl-5'-thioinosine phosphorylase [Methylococcus sp. EFPC2]|uniref:S-methyl-5'-thioinosine phosphorylase n=1 Tax=Methylococcus sp. EFPC2 TaxID=2812648 RepID=UPI0019678192|nr:S-methyl-5'-thioinosine phosphorylase [Methylococcus sp. EFPC2]QSA95535.1 S-methyl-5'-thioinosine phosphorylase [Methylococcus sp. EFPC2]
MSLLAIIGGTGLTRLPEFETQRRQPANTRWGVPSAELTFGRLHGRDIVFLARHGDSHTIPPHRINYRANIQALKDVGVTEIVACAAVGGIRSDMGPARLAVPSQIIDYSYGRAHTYFEDDLDHVTHIDFTFPYTPQLRERLLDAGQQAGLRVVDGGVYGCTQGPRLETPAEITRMERDGCDLVGMTGMPEAALAREAGIDYACVAVVANWAAGKTSEEITMAEIEAHLARGMADLASLLQAFLS